MDPDKFDVLPIEKLVALREEILTNSDPAVVEDRLRQVIEGYGVYNVEYNYSHPIWRARKCDAATSYKSINELWEPPPTLCKAGRLNDPGAPVLYASMNQFSVLEEIDAQPGDHVQIIGFNIGTNKIRCAFVGEFAHFQRWGQPVFALPAKKEINKILTGLGFHKGMAYVYTDAFIASLLRDPNASRDDYIRSRTAARLVFEKLPDLDAIVYQGVAIDGAFNVAIKPSAAHKLLATGAVFVLRIKQRLGLGFFDYEVVARGKGQWADGTIDWQDPFVPFVPPRP